MGSVVPLCHKIILGLALLTASAQARSSPLVLDWQAPADCPTSSDVQRDVMRLVGANVSAGQVLFVRAVVTADAARHFTLTLQTRANQETGERKLTGESCRAVTEAGVLTLALTLNPGLKLPEAAPTDATSNTRESSSSRSQVADADPRRLASDDTHGYVQLLVGMRALAAPDVAGEVGLAFGISYGSLQNWSTATLSPPADAQSDVKPGAGANYWRGSLSDRVCISFGNESFATAPCLGLDASRIQGQGYGFDQNRSASFAWVSAVFGASLAWKLRRGWQARLDGYGLVPLARPYGFVASNGSERLLRPEPLGAQISLGLQYRIW